MKKYITLPIRIEIAKHAGQAAIYIWLGKDSIRDWCLGLALLTEQLIDDFVVGTEDGQHKLTLEMAASLKAGDYICGSISRTALRFMLSANHIATLLAICLKYYRDDWAEVDHIDFEATVVEFGDEDVYLTFRFEDSFPPVSGEEARRRLDNLPDR